MDILNERRKWRSWNINHRAREGECLKILTQKKRYYLCFEVLKCLSLALSPSFVLVLVNHYQVHNEKCTQ